VSTYFLCDPMAVLPSPEGNMVSPWNLVEVPSNDPEIFLSAVRLTPLEALRIRLGDGFYTEAMRQVSGQPPRSLPAERQYHIREETLVDEHGTRNGLRYWFSDRPSERDSNDSWAWVSWFRKVGLPRSSAFVPCFNDEPLIRKTGIHRL
jgi:hypothetical protein